MSLDRFERGAAVFAGVVAVILAAVIFPHLLKDTTLTDTAKATAHHHCVAPYVYSHLRGLCVHSRLTHPSDWVPQFVEILVAAAVILFFAWRKRRSGVAVATFLLGLSLGTAGFIFLFLGAWLMIRAYRLQKYGDATMLGSARKAREMADARRAGKEYTPTPSGDAVASPPKKAPAPSARYTPKKSRGKKR